MARKLLSLCALGVLVACSPGTSSSGPCGADFACPQGCNETPPSAASSACTCTPQSPNISYTLLVSCSSNADCCTGTCSAVDGGQGLCTSVSASGGTTGTTGTSGTTSASGTSSGTSGTTSSSSGGPLCSPGGVDGGTCEVNSSEYGAACGADAGGATCSADFYCDTAKSKCYPLCTACSCWCYGGYVCQPSSGLCEAPGTTTTTTSTTTTTTTTTTGTATGTTGIAVASTSGTTGVVTATIGTGTTGASGTTSGTTLRPTIGATSGTTSGTTSGKTTSSTTSGTTTTTTSTSGTTSGTSGCTCDAACCSAQSSDSSTKGAAGGGILCGDGSYCYGGYYCNQTPGGTGACSKLDPCDGMGGTLSCGGSSSGTTGSSSSGGYAGGCTPTDYYNTEFATCTSSSNCTCSTACVDDPTLGGEGCETACSTAADCPDPITFCSGGSCTPNICSTVYAACGVSSASATDGFCLPYDNGGTEIDLCTLNGSVASGGMCEGANTTSASTSFGVPASDNCASGLVCDPTSTTCATACDPAGGTGPTCGGATTCTSIDSSVGTIGDCE